MILTLLAWLLCAAGIPVLAAACYLAALTVAAFVNPRRRDICGAFDRQRSHPAAFLILIPAHNEAAMIRRTLANLATLDYPPDKTEVIVVADNCTDDTADICRECGTVVLERHDPGNPGKGQALDWAMRLHLAEWPNPFDAVVILDADSTVNSDFLWFLNEDFRKGREILQGYYTVANPAESWRTSLLTASLGLFHFLRPLGRETFGLPCGIRGNGFVLSRRLVIHVGYPAFSNVEDVELTLFHALRDTHAGFVPGAHIYGEMTSQSDAAATQRTRWEGGRITMIKQWGPALLKRAVRERSAPCLDALVDLLIPPFALLGLLTGGIVLAAVLLVLSEPGTAATAALCLSTAAVFCELLYVAGGLILIRAPLLVWRRMIFAPVYAVWKMAVYAKMLVNPASRRRWERTRR